MQPHVRFIGTGDFQPEEGGEKETGPIQVRITAELQTSETDSSYTDADSAEFSVIVNDGEVKFSKTDDTEAIQVVMRDSEVGKAHVRVALPSSVLL